MKIDEIAFHRNGVSGQPFYTIKFYDPDYDPDYGSFFAIVHEGQGCCFVLSHGVLLNHEPLANNAWRGDYYEGFLRDAIKEWEDKRKLGS